MFSKDASLYGDQVGILNWAMFLEEGHAKLSIENEDELLDVLDRALDRREIRAERVGTPGRLVLVPTTIRQPPTGDPVGVCA